MYKTGLKIVGKTMRQIVEQYLEYYNSFLIDEMLDLFTEDCVFQNISNTSDTMTCIGKNELKALASQTRSIFQTRQQTATNWIIAPEKIAIEINFTAVFATDLPNGVKQGQQCSLKGVSIYEFEGGKIKRLVDYS